MQYDEDDELIFPAEQFELDGDRTATVLAVVPDVCLDHLSTLLRKFKETDVVVNELLERPYPKNRSSPGKGKKRARSEDPSDEQERDWLNVKERGETSLQYRDDALEQLCVNFKLVPKGAIRTALVSSSHCYSPAFLLLQQKVSQSEDERGWKDLKVGRGGSKGKDKEVVVATELAKEMVCLTRRMEEMEKENMEEEREREEGLLVECGCCYGEFGFQRLYQCSEGHLACKECCLANTNTQIELQRFTLTCMDDGCTAFFPEVEAARFLSRGTLKALRRLKQQSEIDQARLEGLEKCPFCPYACVIDNPDEKLLVCRREGCEITSCRKCKKEEHLPKSCAEMIKDNNIHAVEDAMSAALIRNCPKCLLPYLKLSGCNYITCSGCGAGSCYVCQQICPKSPEHYDMGYNPAGGSSVVKPGKKCSLYDYDNSTAADLKTIEAARLEASAMVMSYNSDISLADVDKLKERMAAPYYPNQGPPPIPPQWPPQPPTWQQRPPPTQLQPQFQYSRPPPPPPPPPPPRPPSGQYYATNSVSPPPVSGPPLASFGPMSSIYGQQAQLAPVAQQQGWTGGEWGTGASGSANDGAYSGGTLAAGPHGRQPLGRQLSVSHQPGAVPFSSGGSSAELWFSNSAGSPPPEHAPPQTQHQPEPRSDRPYFSHFLNTTLPDVRFEGKEIESPTYERILPRRAVAPFPFEFPPLEPAFVPPAIVEEEEEEEVQYRMESPFVRSDEAPTPPLLVASPPIMTPPSSSTTPTFEIHSPVSPQRTESLFSVADPYHPTSQSPLQYNQSLHNSNRQSLEIPDHCRRLPQPPTLQDAPPPPPPTSPTPPTVSYDLVPTLADQPYPASPEPTPPAVPDDTVYFCTLRCAMLADILSVQPPAPPPPPPTESAVSTPIHHSTSYGLSSPLLSRHSSSSSTSTTLSSLRRLKESGKDAWAKSLDKVKEVRGVDGGSSSLYFPSSALKALETRLQRIAANAVPLYPDRDFQASVGDFQDKLVAEPFRTSFKKEGTVEELLLVFGRTAQTTLRGRHQGHEWVELLDAHMAMFAGVVRDVLKTQGVSGEIITRLDAHASRLGTAPPTLEKTPSRSSRASSISSHRKSAEFEVVSYPETGTMLDLRDMRLVQVVGRMFGQTEADLAHDVDSLRHICTEKAAYLDLRHLVNNIAKGAEFPARREDFDSDSSFQQWRKDENHELSSLLVEMLSRHPSLREADGDVSALVFVPPLPKPTYARLVDFALKASSRDDEVLSSDYEELFDVCVTRWRLTTPARVNSLLAAAVDPDVSMELVYYALDELDAATGTWDYDRWPWAERQALFNSLQSLFDILLPRLARIFQGALQLPFAAVVDPLERIYSNQVYAEDARELAEVFVSLKGSIVCLVERAYVAKRDAIHASIPEAAPPEEALEPLFQLLQHLMEESKRYTKEFRTQLFGNIDVPALFIGVAAPLFVKDLEGAQETLAAIASRAQGAPPDDDILDLYKNTVKLQKMHDSYCRENPLVIPYSALFGAYVKRWISATADTMAKVWVARAIENDKFELDDGSPQLFSTSVGDIIDGCKGAIKTLQDFAWPDEVESAQFATKISQAIANAIQQYSISLEQLFMAEVFPQTGAAEEEESWFKKAALAVKGGNKVDRFVFQVKSLVKLNNIEEARRLLDTMSLSLNAEAVGAVLDKHPLPTSPEGTRWLFTIKVVSGEKLVAPDGSRGTLESFVALHDLAGYQISRTRTVQDSNDPRWEQSFDIMLRNELMVQATVYSRITGKDAEIGRARFHLDPSEFQPLVRRDLLLPLEGAHGPSKILVRIRMEPETDDPRFYFGRAFRSLKRTEKEMARVIVSKVLPVVRSYLSMATLRTLLGTNVSNLIDSQMLLDKTRTNLTIAASSAATSGTRAALALTARMNALLEGTPEQLIPDVIDRHDVPPAPEAATRPGPPTPREVQQQAIAPLEPLVDYLNDTMRTLFTTLSTAAWMKFSERLWYEILATIEELVLPPLSDQPSDKKPLTERELDVVFRWLHFMVEFLHENGDGMEMSALHNAKYGELMMAHLYYEMDSDELQIEVIRSMQRQLSTSSTLLVRSKSVYAHSNLSTIKKTKSEKRKELDGITGPLILRILRMRPGLEEFIKHQVGLLNLPPPGTEAHRRALAGREMPGGRRAAAAANRGQGQGAGMRAGGLAAIPDGVE